MNSNRQVVQLVLHAKGPYTALLFIVPLMILPAAVTGLVAKGVFDILQGVESVSALSGWIDIDVGETVDQKINLVFWLVGGLVGMELLRVFPYLFGYYWFNRMNFLITSLLQRNMLSSVYRRPGAEGLPDSAGEAISRFRGDPEQVAGFVFASHNLFVNLSVGVLALVLLMSVDVMVTTVVFLPLLVIVAVAHVASARVQKYRLASRETTGKVTGIIGEVFGAIQAVQVAGAENLVMDHFRQFNEARRKAGLKDLLFNNLLGAVFGGVSSIGLGVVLLLVGREMRSGTFSAGDFALYQYYLGWIMAIPAGLGFFLIGAQQVRVSVHRMQEMMRGEPLEKLVESSPTYLWGRLPTIPYVAKQPEDRFEQLDIHGLTYHYLNSDNGIDDINLTVKRGDFVVVTGRVGAGKSTLLRSILGLLPIQNGETYWNHQLVDTPDKFFVPPRTAYVPQVPRLYSDSLRDNILLGLPEGQVDIAAALKRAALEEIEDALEDGLDTLVGPRGVKLSGGQIQRTAAARMFIRDAELLVFDDLSSALDVDTERLLWRRMFETENTCIVVSHRPAVLKEADRIIVLKEGKIVEQGPPEQLFVSSEELQLILADSKT